MQLARSWTTSGLLLAALLGLGPVGQTAFALDAPAPASDAEARRQVVGVWVDDYQGERTMTVREDGTATMVVKLRGWKAFVYASELQFEMLWSIDDGRMKKTTTGGRPAGKVNLILKALGNETVERILELTSERLLLLDQDGKRRYDWRRKPAPSEKARPGPTS